jgi:hypothetical protein
MMPVSESPHAPIIHIKHSAPEISGVREKVQLFPDKAGLYSCWALIIIIIITTAFLVVGPYL